MDVKTILALIHDHQFATAGIAFFSSTLGLSILARFLAWLPLKWWFATVTTVFTGIAKAGNLRFGAPLWEPFEDAFENLLGGTVDAIRKGLEAGDVPPPSILPPPPAPRPSLEMQADIPPPSEPKP